MNDNTLSLADFSDDLPFCPRCAELMVCHYTPLGRFYECLECSAVFAFRPVTVFRLTQVYCLPNFNPIGEKSCDRSPLQTGRTGSGATVEKIDPENLRFCSPSLEAAKVSGSTPPHWAVSSLTEPAQRGGLHYNHKGDFNHERAKS